jgi:tetratricopeptide (TPR) repeat protein
MAQLAESFLHISEEKFSRGDFDGGLEALTQAINIEPKNPFYYMRRAYIQYSAEHYKEAAEDFTKVIDLSTDIEQLQDAYNKRAIAYEFSGCPKKTLSDLNWLIMNQFGDASLYAYRAHINSLLENMESAIEDLSIAIRLDPKNVLSLLQRAMIYYKTSAYDLAIADLNEIINLEENHPKSQINILRWRGMSYYKLGHEHKALNDFNSAMKLEGGICLTSASDYMKLYDQTFK